MSDKATRFGQYTAQGGKDGEGKDAVTIKQAPEPERNVSVQPPPLVK